MSMVILEACINCGNCEPACPNEAISAGASVYQVEPAHCTECVGAFDQPQCVDACPIPDCVSIDPARIESREVLLSRYQEIHAG